MVEERPAGVTKLPAKKKTASRVPRGGVFEVAGSALHKAVTADFELSGAELAVLAAACRQADDVARLEALLAADGLITVGSKGQPKLSTVVAELRLGRLALARLLEQLRLPQDEDETVGKSPRQRRASVAASARWNRRDRAAARQEERADGAS